MIKHVELSVDTQRYNELVPLGERVKEAVEQSGVREGVVYVVSAHTTCGVTVNERLECLEDDILERLSQQFPEDGAAKAFLALNEYGDRETEKRLTFTFPHELNCPVPFDVIAIKTNGLHETPLTILRPVK